MVRILKIGENKRQKRYFKVICPYCNSLLVFERAEIWIDDPKNGIGRVECPNPGCRMKVHMHLTFDIYSAEETVEETYNSAVSDTSKSGLQILMDAKKEELRSKEGDHEKETEAGADRD